MKKFEENTKENNEKSERREVTSVAFKLSTFCFRFWCWIFLNTIHSSKWRKSEKKKIAKKPIKLKSEEFFFLLSSHSVFSLIFFCMSFFLFSLSLFFQAAYSVLQERMMLERARELKTTLEKRNRMEALFDQIHMLLYGTMFLLFFTILGKWKKILWKSDEEIIFLHSQKKISPIFSPLSPLISFFPRLNSLSSIFSALSLRLLVWLCAQIWQFPIAAQFLGKLFRLGSVPAHVPRMFFEGFLLCADGEYCICDRLYTFK